ncbi:MAG: TIGR01777 family oxidoreductase [Candidatus Poribacteria bacterium]|nr:TIGR01777 family oxidoreductase [Candidatus Poribacteria bacterium]
MSEPLTIGITGSSGLVGTRLTALLTERGHAVRRFVRREPRGADEVRWNPSGGELASSALDGLHAVVNLAGENIGGGAWTKERKAAILNSRVDGTRLLAETVAVMDNPPKTFVSASALGYYGSRGDERLTEESSNGDDFLADVCRQWEAATQSAESSGKTRVVRLRLGLVMAAKGGMLDKMLTPFKMGVGGQLGDGRHWMSWIDADDLARAILYVIEDDSLSGAVNVVSPNPVTNAEFTKALGKVLNRPTLLPVPVFALKVMFGQMSEMIMASQRVEPTKLVASGFTFEYSGIEAALRHVLG